MSENHIGYTLYIAQALPATNDAAGFEALTWVQVKGLVEGPQFGFTHEQINIPDLQSGFTSAVKGASMGVDTQFQCRTISADPGQLDVKEQADDNDGLCSLKLGKGTGTDQALQTGDYVEYSQGFIHSYQPNKPTTTSFEGFTASFRSNAATVVATEPA